MLIVSCGLGVVYLLGCVTPLFLRLFTPLSLPLTPLPLVTCPLRLHCIVVVNALYTLQSVRWNYHIR